MDPTNIPSNQEINSTLANAFPDPNTAPAELHDNFPQTTHLLSSPSIPPTPQPIHPTSIENTENTPASADVNMPFTTTSAAFVSSTIISQEEILNASMENDKKRPRDETADTLQRSDQEKRLRTEDTPAGSVTTSVSATFEQQMEISAPAPSEITPTLSGDISTPAPAAAPQPTMEDISTTPAPTPAPTQPSSRISSLLERLKQKVSSTEDIIKNIPIKPPTPQKIPGTTTKKIRRGPRKEKEFMENAPQEFRAALYIITKMMAAPTSWPFNKPVDVKGLNLTDYHLYVKKPMDLGTARKNLLSDKYATIEEFHDDVELVFSNCKAYNGPAADVTIMGSEVQKIFMEAWPLLLKAKQGVDVIAELINIGPQVPLPGSTNKSKSTDATSVPTAAATTTTTTGKKRGRKPGSKNKTTGTKKSTTTTGTKKKATTTSTKKSTTPTAPVLPQMTFHEKKTLTEDIGKLNTDQNHRVLDIIRKGSPVAYSTGSSEEEVEVDLDKLSTSTLRELQAYVRQCLESKAKAPQYIAKPLEQAGVVGTNGTAATAAAEETDSSSDDDSDSSSDDESSDDENKHINTPLSMASIEMRPASRTRRRKSGEQGNSAVSATSFTKNRAHYSIDDTVVFRNLSKPQLPPTILLVNPDTKQTTTRRPLIFDKNHKFDASKYICFEPADNVEQWNRLLESTMALEDQVPDMLLEDALVLRNIGVRMEQSETANRLWQKSRADFYAKQKREEMKLRKLEQQQQLKEQQMQEAKEEDEEARSNEADEHEEFAEGLDEFGSFM